MSTPHESITLTIREIVDLARFAGLLPSGEHLPDEDELEEEITVQSFDGGKLTEDDGTQRAYRRIAYYAEYPEEGCLGLGPELSDQETGVIPASKFNDDDLYVYDPGSMELIEQVAASNVARHLAANPSLSACIGLTAKYLGLWRRKQSTKKEDQ